MTPDDNATLQLQGIYNTLCHAITRPDRKFAITRYFLDEWVPLLGPSLAWLIVALRQRCFWNDRRDWCVVDQATLSRETALKARSIERNLQKPYADWFVLDITRRYRYHHNIGKKVRDRNRYHLLLTEPLSPRHQTALETLLRQRLAEETPADSPLEMALRLIRSLLDDPHLTARLNDAVSPPKPPQPRTIWQLLENVLDVSFAGRADRAHLARLDEACAQLHNHIVQPNKVYIGWQYFRLKWVPLLGHALAWLVVFLRRHCYWDEKTGILRDECIFYKKDLAAAIGQTTRNLNHLFQNPHASLFFSCFAGETDAADSPDAPPRRTRNQPLRYRVRMVDDPLTPEDQAQIDRDIEAYLQQSAPAEDPESGQRNFLPFLPSTPKRQNFAYPEVSEKMSDRNTKKCRLGEEVSEKMSDRSERGIGKNVGTLKIPFKKHDEGTKEQQQQNAAAAANYQSLKELLTRLDVREPVRGKLLAKPALTPLVVRAWMLYAETQDGLSHPVGYAINRLLADDPPPPDFIAFARLSADAWARFEETAAQIAGGQLTDLPLSPDETPLFLRWVAVYTDLNPDDLRARLLRPPPSAASSPSPTPADESAARLWRAVCRQLQGRLTRATYNRHITPLRVHSWQDGVLTLLAPSPWAREWLEARLAKIVSSAVEIVAGAPVRVQFLCPPEDP